MVMLLRTGLVVMILLSAVVGGSRSSSNESHTGASTGLSPAGQVTSSPHSGPEICYFPLLYMRILSLTKCLRSS